MKNGPVFESDPNADAAFDFGLRVIDFEGPVPFDQPHGVFDGHLFAVFAVECELRQMRDAGGAPEYFGGDIDVCPGHRRVSWSPPTEWARRREWE
ncbi:hypothetical protein [Methylosinus sp. Sm6]|uniref:hypothetical protein n=1 Tax=Methylosinus sp. Sm6 TaxID=2866948 RepID=UPI001C994248|nr:hypothetical protein [Methylosinus sp. Sm6]MBY6240488.1 hypothetical protein [Methylosinus sp. Sm6]